ncbi:MAG: N-acetyltransferase family protein [Parvularculaceae bacterium]
MSLSVRPARPDDAAAINAIYNPLIRDSAITFETVEHSEEDRRRWLATLARSPRHQVFVAAADGAVCGYANAAEFDPRGAYETSVKVSIFVAPSHHRQGVGRALYGELFEAVAKTDVHRAYALIVAPNPASVVLHEAFGFRHVSTLNEVGRKFSRYWDVLWYEKRF